MHLGSVSSGRISRLTAEIHFVGAQHESPVCPLEEAPLNLLLYEFKVHFRALREFLFIKWIGFQHEMQKIFIFFWEIHFFIEQRLKQSFIRLRGRRQVSPSGVCVRRVRRPFAIWMTRFSNQRICWPSLLRSPLLCCHILQSPFSSVSFVRHQAAAEQSSISADVWTSRKAFIHGPCLPTHFIPLIVCR